MAILFYYIAFSVCVLGFAVHRSQAPSIGPYSISYVAFLAVLSLGWTLPLAYRRIAGTFGLRALSFSFLPAALTVILLYAGSAMYYYGAETHRFDPYLQATAPTPAAGIKPAGAIRILALGGSTTLDDTLPDADRYPRVLEARLRHDHPADTIEVFNAGMDWFTTKHSLINYVTNLQEWRPDIVIVMHGINDLYRSFSDPDVALGEYDRSWSHFYGPSINGANPPTFERTMLGRVSQYWFSGLREITYTERDTPLDRYVSLPDYRRNLDRLVHYLRADGVQVVLLTEPSIYKNTMTADERAVLWFGRRLCKRPAGWLRYDYPSPASLGAAMHAFNGVTTEVAAAAHVTVVDVANGLEKTLENFSDDVHYQVAGAHRVGDIVARGVEAAGVLQIARSQ